MNIAGHRGEGEAPDIHGKSPQEIVGGDETGERSEGNPHGGNFDARSGERIHQHLHAVLRADRAGHGREDRSEDQPMGRCALFDVMSEKCERAARKCTNIIHRAAWFRSCSNHRPRDSHNVLPTDRLLGNSGN